MAGASPTTRPTDEEGPMRERVAAALQTTSPKGITGPGSADDPDAHRGAVAARWPLLDAQNQTPPHSIPVVRCSLLR
jgi:hypothetical protein